MADKKKFAFLKANEGVESRFWGPVFFALYGIIKRESLRKVIRALILKIEKGHVYTVTLRKIFAYYHGVEIGMYSGRGPFFIDHFKKGTRIGRYTAIYRTVRAFNANHPMNTKSTHAFFYNPNFGLAEEETLQRAQLTIGNDVWIGHNAIVLSGVASIGDGAIIGAGSVVHQDVPPYAVVVGNPARIVRYRFTEETIKTLLNEKWWEKGIDELKQDAEAFQKPLEKDTKVR